MTPEELRAAIPAVQETTYLNTGASGPSPEPVVEAIKAALEYHEYESPGREGMYPSATDVFDETRATVAAFIGATPESIALTESTTDGINRIATALDWSAGDTVVISDVEHSAGRLPWRRLERTTGIEVVVVPSDEGRFDLDAYAEALEDATLLCVSSLDWLYGRRHPVDALVSIAHDEGALALVDAVQSVGQHPVDVTDWGADFVAAAGHKWLLGPWGGGFLYANPAVVSDLSPAHVGYRSVKDAHAEDVQWAEGAGRFEIGTISPAVYAGLGQAIDTIESIGLGRIRDHIEGLVERFKDGVPADRLRSPREFHSGLVTVAVDDPETAVDRLAAEDVVIRALPLSNSVRVSLHAFNTAEDVDRVRSALATELD